MMDGPMRGGGEGSGGSPATRRVLLAEDQMLVAMHFEDMLVDLCCNVRGAVPSVAAALQVIRREPLDGAVLDVTLRDGQSFPVARELRARAIPFLFVTGYGNSTLPEDLQDAPWMAKPVSPARFARLVDELLRRGH
jgi:CheY-like chemotaxis protein